jgi:hypothetical protein
MDCESYHVEIYITKGDMVCIRQEDGDSEDRIILHPHQIPVLIKWLKVAATDALSESF